MQLVQLAFICASFVCLFVCLSLMCFAIFFVQHSSLVSDDAVWGCLIFSLYSCLELPSLIPLVIMFLKVVMFCKNGFVCWYFLVILYSYLPPSLSMFQFCYSYCCLHFILQYILMFIVLNIHLLCWLCELWWGWCEKCPQRLGVATATEGGKDQRPHF